MRLAAALFVAMFAGAACSTAPAQTPRPPSAGPPSLAPTESARASLTPPATEPTIASAAPSATAAASGDPIAIADAICRDNTYRDPGPLTVSATVGDLVTIVYAGTEGDFVCQYQPIWGNFPIIRGGSQHLADQVDSNTPMVRDGNFTYSSDTGTYIWGAVGPEVASVVIELGAPGSRIEASMAGGYFLAAIRPNVPCCLYTAVALDSDAQQIARAK